MACERCKHKACIMCVLVCGMHWGATDCRVTRARSFTSRWVRVLSDGQRTDRPTCRHIRLSPLSPSSLLLPPPPSIAAARHFVTLWWWWWCHCAQQARDSWTSSFGALCTEKHYPWTGTWIDCMDVGMFTRHGMMMLRVSFRYATSPTTPRVIVLIIMTTILLNPQPPRAVRDAISLMCVNEYTNCTLGISGS